MTMTQEPIIRNGVDTATLFATLKAVEENPDIAKFRFRASNTWVNGTHSRSTIHGFHGAMQDQHHQREFTYDSDHPEVLVGRDNGPTPVEHVLHGLAGCLTAGLANIAAARGIDLEEVTSTVAGDIDLMGILGLDEGVRNGYQQISVSFRVKGNASAEELRSLVERSRARSAVFDMLTNPVPISIDVEVL